MMENFLRIFHYIWMINHGEYFLIQIFRAKEVVDNSVSFVKSAMSAVIIDSERIVVGSEEGLFCIDLDRTGKYRWIGYAL